MFTVNIEFIKEQNSADVFQNISCLRLILSILEYLQGYAEFQNISCLRLIKEVDNFIKEVIRFQNISCLRLIVGLTGTPAPNGYFKTFHVYG